jgi:NCAIR mutase (PurE)-related protein
VLTAGTSDVPVAREAVRTLAYYGEACREFHDIGVAGLWRLTDRLHEIRSFPVLIVAAGMDAALASVVGGLVASVVIVVPTPTGYGVSANGEVALHSALVSCAPGVVVVNIENGYGAACAALRVLRVSRAFNKAGIRRSLATARKVASAT